ncbi:hypothetical protein ACA910_018937 [Epithemia clementina (nom. ined.)]
MIPPARICSVIVLLLLLLWLVLPAPLLAANALAFLSATTTRERNKAHCPRGHVQQQRRRQHQMPIIKEIGRIISTSSKSCMRLRAKGDETRPPYHTFSSYDNNDDDDNNNNHNNDDYSLLGWKAAGAVGDSSEKAVGEFIPARRSLTQRFLAAGIFTLAGTISSNVLRMDTPPPPQQQQQSHRSPLVFVPEAQAAPPIAIIAEELGYFPVTNGKNQTVYVPKRIQRDSSDQAVALAQQLRQSGAVVYTAFWCPHCARQKEILGRQAWHELLQNNIECAPQGYQAQPTLCLANKKVSGYPTWILGDGTVLAGERSLTALAQAIHYDQPIDESLERNVPPPLGSSACK